MKHIQTINASPETLYSTWLDSEGHSNRTGGEAHFSDVINDKFTAWDGYITRSNIELVSNEKIVQGWRTSEFDSSDEESLLEIQLKPLGDQAELTLIHSNIPAIQTQYENRWIESYFEPMKEKFK